MFHLSIEDGLANNFSSSNLNPAIKIAIQFPGISLRSLNIFVQ